MKLCSKLSMLFVEFMRKTSNLGIWPLFWEVRGDARLWFMARWKAHGQLSICLNWFFLTIYYGFEVTARLFSQWVDLFALKFYPDRVVPINHSWHQKTRHTALPDGKDRISLRSFVLTQYRSVTDGQTCRRVDGFAVAYTALAKLCFGACKILTFHQLSNTQNTMCRYQHFKSNLKFYAAK